MPTIQKYDKLATFRVPSNLLIHARKIAKHQGMGLSTFVRQAMRRNIDAYLLNERKTLVEFR